jgi:hypothetical protein
MVNLPIEYSDKPVMPFGGMALMKDFIDQTAYASICHAGTAPNSSEPDL